MRRIFRIATWSRDARSLNLEQIYYSGKYRRDLGRKFAKMAVNAA